MGIQGRRRIACGLGVVGLLLLLIKPAEAESRAPSLTAPAHGELAHLLDRAAQHAGVATGGLRALARRSRLAALAPSIRVQFGQGGLWLAGSSRTDLQADLPQDSNGKWQYSLAATWDLARLIYSRDELNLRREQITQASVRHRLLQDVARSYFRRCSRLRETPSQETAPRGPAAPLLLLDAELAALTGEDLSALSTLRCEDAGLDAGRTSGASVESTMRRGPSETSGTPGRRRQPVAAGREDPASEETDATSFSQQTGDEE